MTNLSYYASLWGANELAGNRFVNLIMGTVADLAAVTLCWMVAESIDGRKIYMISTLLSAFGLAVTPFIDASFIGI